MGLDQRGVMEYLTGWMGRECPIRLQLPGGNPKLIGDGRSFLQVQANQGLPALQDHHGDLHRQRRGLAHGACRELYALLWCWTCG